MIGAENAVVFAAAREVSIFLQAVYSPKGFRRSAFLLFFFQFDGFATPSF